MNTNQILIFDEESGDYKITKEDFSLALLIAVLAEAIADGNVICRAYQDYEGNTLITFRK